MCHSRALSCPRGVTYVSLASVALPSRCYTCVTREHRPALAVLPTCRSRASSRARGVTYVSLASFVLRS
eukprot:705887-Pyramimonas_sp.AAC.1